MPLDRGGEGLGDKTNRETVTATLVFGLSRKVNECHFLSLQLSMLCYALMNSIVP